MDRNSPEYLKMFHELVTLGLASNLKDPMEWVRVAHWQAQIPFTTEFLVAFIQELVEIEECQSINEEQAEGVFRLVIHLG